MQCRDLLNPGLCCRLSYLSHKSQSLLQTIKKLRQFYWQEGFTEVETPTLMHAATGANAKPYQTHNDAFDLDLMFQFDLAEGEYHTNVVLSCLAGKACMIHAGSFADAEVPKAISEFYKDRTIFLTDAEKLAFAGNGITITETLKKK